MFFKRLAFLVIVIAMASTANAQFEQGKIFVGSSLTGLNMSYSGLDHLRLGIQAQGGYFLEDNILVHANAEFRHSENSDDVYSAGVGGRYYIIQNGIFLGANAKWIHARHSYNDVMPGVEVGYAFFINGSVTIEPAIYYNQSFKNHSDFSEIGLKIGLGIYLK